MTDKQTHYLRRACEKVSFARGSLACVATDFTKAIYFILGILSLESVLFLNRMAEATVVLLDMNRAGGGSSGC